MCRKETSKRELFKSTISICIFLLAAAVAVSQGSDLKAINLRTEYKIDPVTDEVNPRLSWELESSRRSQVQTAFQILVATSPELLSANKADLWNSEKMATNQTNQVVYAGKALTEGEICFWVVRSWDKDGVAGKWSKAGKWEIGLLNKNNWKAHWIGNDLTAFGKGIEYHLPPAPFFRKKLALKGTIKKARLYASALGLYEFYINGQRVGNDYFTPGWTDYDKRVYYNVYDVKNYLKTGENVVGSIVGEGWYSGYIGYALLINNPVVKNFYGKVPLLKAQLVIEYDNGQMQTIGTDETWKTSHGPIVENDILNGETYDARLAFNDWSTVRFVDKIWKSAQVYEDKPERKMEVYPGNPLRVYKEMKALSITPKPGGKYIFDLGQNFAGNVRVKVKGRAGDTITLRYGEVLFPNGDLMTENLRKARATDTYILSGDPNGETYTPRFTYHGFQFVEVTGFLSKPELDAVTGIVLSSATPEAGSFVTDNSMVNQLYHNIVWTQRSNYFDVPTDCPQRDERLGWTGDAQAYIKSASFNNDISAFFTKWMVDLNDGQRVDNTYPLYAPAPNVRVTDTYSPGWSEAGIICPYTIYKTYGDVKMIRQFWPNMVAYLKFLENKSNGTFVFKERSFEDISPKGGYGDWLSVGKKTPPDLLASIYFAYCASLMQEMASAIGEEADAEYFQSVFNKVKKAFIGHYTDGKGRFQTDTSAYGNGDGYIDGELGFDGHTQTAYANAIYMNILNAADATIAGNYIKALIKSNGGKLSTGFLGVKPLLPALSATGHSDEAYKLLLSKEYPSWGFEVMNGANTIWERWNSYIKGKGFENNAGMNSFNHYAFGSVNEWLFGNAAGIKVDEAGYRKFILKPEIAKEGIGYVKAIYHSINGDIISFWRKDGKKVIFEFTVPVNTSANIFISTTNPDTVVENSQLLKINSAIRIKAYKDGLLNVEIGSGTYKFIAEN